jgi:ABC-2 type transport system ATP-binding protein
VDKILELAGVSAGYRGEPVVTGVHATAGAGERLALRGPNGAGKSTLLRCAAGLTPVLAGTILVAGGVADDRSPAFRREVSSLLETGWFYPDLRLAEHLALIQRASQPLPAGWFTATELLDILDIQELSHRVPGECSSGEKQKLALAMALARPSRLLLLDEPERHLDEPGRAALAALLTRYPGAIVFATHDAALVGATGARELMLA